MPPDYNCYVCRENLPCAQVLPDMPVYICSDCAAKKGIKPVTWDDVDNKVSPPWNDEQLASLKSYLSSRTFLPFVCPQHHAKVAKSDGLHCRVCNTHQAWTYDWTLNWSWKLLEPPESSGRPSKRTPPSPPKSDSISLDLPEPDETNDQK